MLFYPCLGNTRAGYDEYAIQKKSKYAQKKQEAVSKIGDYTSFLCERIFYFSGGYFLTSMKRPRKCLGETNSTRKSLRDFVQTSEVMYVLSVLRQKWSEMSWAVSAGLNISWKLCEAEQELLHSETAKKRAG